VKISIERERERYIYIDKSIRDHPPILRDEKWKMLENTDHNGRMGKYSKKKLKLPPR